MRRLSSAAADRNRVSVVRRSDNALADVGEPARIAFARATVPSASVVDAVWWPRSYTLAIELPPLMDVIWHAGHDIARVTYNSHSWEPAPRRLRISDRVVRLGGFASSDTRTVRLFDLWGRERVDLRVVSPDISPTVADHIFELTRETDFPYRVTEDE